MMMMLNQTVEQRRNTLKNRFAAILLAIVALTSVSRAQDYDGETETAITGLSGLSGLSGLTGLSALANGVVTGYAPMNSGGSDSAGVEGFVQAGASGDGSSMAGDRSGLGASESSDSDSGDYEDDSQDSSASEEQPILSKFFNLLSGAGRSKRSVDQAEAPAAAAAATTGHSRVKRGYKGWVPYVSTYVKTDKKANFKWGVKAKVGKKYGK